MTEITTELNLVLTKYVNALDGIVCYEPVDAACFEKIMKSDLLLENSKNPMTNMYMGSELKLLNTFKSKINKDTGLAEVKYERCAGMSYGRSNPKRASGMFLMRSKVRHTLAERKGLSDWDIENAHPQILLQICKANTLACSQLEYYCKNRDEILAKVMRLTDCDRKRAKLLFIRLLYFGKIEGWMNEEKDKDGVIVYPEISIYDFKDDDGFMSWIGSLTAELEGIGKHIVRNNPKLVAEVTKNKELKKKLSFNLNASVVSFFLQEYEIQILEQIYKYCCEKGYIKDNVCILCADGIMLEDKLIVGVDIPTEFQQVIKEKTGFELTITNKALDKGWSDEFLDEHDNVNSQTLFFADNDNECATIIYEQIKDCAIWCRGQLFFKKNNIWVNDLEHFNNMCLHKIMNSNIVRKDKDKMTKLWANTSRAKAVVEAVLVNVKLNAKDNLYDRFHQTTKRTICFKDGVLDFKEKTFTKWLDLKIEYYSCVQVDMEYADYFENPTKEIIDEITNNILYPLFHKNLDKALHFFSRAITGHNEDKNYATYLGYRDCGKSLFYDGMKSFGDYVKSFALSNVLCSRNSKQNTDEISRRLYWLLEYEFVRVAIAQETPKVEEGLKINPELWKKLNSGGDELQARRNYDRVDTYFKSDTTWYIMGNDPVDMGGDLQEHLIEFEGKYQFKTEEEIDQETEAKKDLNLPKTYWDKLRVRDPTFTQKMKTLSFQKAFIYIMYTNYKDEPVNIEYSYDVEDTEDGNVLATFFKNYIITNDPNDKVLISSLGSKTAFKKMKPELDNLGLIIKKSNTRDETKDKKCLFGVKSRVIEE